MADVTVSESVGISESSTAFVPYWRRDIVGVSESRGIEITLRLEHVPTMAEIPRIPLMQSMGCEEEGME